MGIVKFARPLLIVAVVVGVGASSFWAGHGSSGSPSLQVNTYQPGWVNQPWLGETMPISAALSPVADSLGVVYYLDYDSGSWQRYIPGRPEVSNLDTMVFGRAYLMLFTKPVTATLSTEPEDICPATPGSADQRFYIYQDDFDNLCVLLEEVVELNGNLQTLWWNLATSSACTLPTSLGYSVGYNEYCIEGPACAEGLDWRSMEIVLSALDDRATALTTWCLFHTPARPAAQ